MRPPHTAQGYVRMPDAEFEELLARAAAEITATVGGAVWPQACDVADREAVGRLMAWTAAEVGPPAIVVNSAGINVMRRKMAELHAVLPGMRARQDGLVVSIASIAGKRAFPLAGPGYCASKFGAAGLAATVGLEELPHGIRITSIHPGEVDTPILDQRPEPIPAERRKLMVHPEDIAACVVMLAKLPRHVVVPELVITPTYQAFA